MNNITVVVERISPTTAREYLATNLNNRKVNRETVSFYKKQMLDGNWQLSPEGISFDKYCNLLDGQHRLLAVIEANVSISFIVSRGFDREVFSVINTGKNRNASDVLSIANIPNSSATTSIINKATVLKNNSKIYATSQKTLKLSNTDVLNEYEDNKELLKKTFIASQNHYRKNKLLTISEIGSIIYFLTKYKHHNELPFSFFNELFSYSEFAAINDLRNKLIMSKANKLEHKVKITYIIKAWNAFLTKKDVKILRYSEGEDVNFL